MTFEQLHELLTKELGLLPEPLPSGAGVAYFYGRVARGKNTTRILRIHNNGACVQEIKRSMSSLEAKEDVLVDAPMDAAMIRQAVKEEIEKYRGRQGG